MSQKAIDYCVTDFGIQEKLWYTKLSSEAYLVYSSEKRVLESVHNFCIKRQEVYGKRSYLVVQIFLGGSSSLLLDSRIRAQ